MGWAVIKWVLNHGCPKLLKKMPKNENADKFQIMKKKKFELT